MATTKTPAARAESTVITLPPQDLRIAAISLVGTAPLIQHRWSEKNKRQMRDRQTKKATQGRETRNPEQDFRDSLYVLPDGTYCMPSLAFKNAAVTACSQVAGVTKVQARGAFHVLGEFVPLLGEPRMREDMVRLGGFGGVADLRYRGEFPEWSCILQVEYAANVISLQQLATLFDYAGFAVGVGEWRPEKDGSFGRFRVASIEDIAVGDER